MTTLIIYLYKAYSKTDHCNVQLFYILKLQYNTLSVQIIIMTIIFSYNSPGKQIYYGYVS